MHSGMKKKRWPASAGTDMQSKNKPAQSAAERRHVARVAELPCVVCQASGPSSAHEPEQGMWFIALPLCHQCHQGPEGWHGTRLRWHLRKMTELKAINETIRQLEVAT
jgi:hypothetical protein